MFKILKVWIGRAKTSIPNKTHQLSIFEISEVDFDYSY